MAAIPFLDSFNEEEINPHWNAQDGYVSHSSDWAVRGMRSLKMRVEVGQPRWGSWVRCTLADYYPLLYMSAYVYFKDFPAAGDEFDCMIGFWSDSPDSQAAYMNVRRTDAGVLLWHLRYMKNGVLDSLRSFVPALETDKEYFCEIMVKRDAVNGEFNFWVDEALILSDDTFDSADSTGPTNNIYCSLGVLPVEEQKIVYMDMVRADIVYIKPERARTGVRSISARHGGL